MSAVAHRRAGRWWTLAPALMLFALIAVAPIGELLAMSLSRIDWVGSSRAYAKAAKLAGCGPMRNRKCQLFTRPENRSAFLALSYQHNTRAM